MNFNVRNLAIETFVPALRTLSRLLEKGGEHRALAQARLAPDMFNLAQQVEMACFYARDAVARLVGGEPAPVEDNKDEGLDELKARIARTLADLQKVPDSAFEGAAERPVKVDLTHGMVLETQGFRYLTGWGFPHFYFHVVTAYDILRHNGVPLGKRDYISMGDAIHRR
jgi:hypothetical protein